MSKVKIYIKTNSNDDTNDIYLLLKEATRSAYEIYLIDCMEEFKKPTLRPYHTACFFNCGNFYFHYDVAPTTSKLAEYDMLVKFAQDFQNTVTNVIKNSKHKDRLNESEMWKANKKVAEFTEGLYRNNLVNSEPFSTVTHYSSNISSTSNFFPTNPQFSNSFKVELAFGVVLGLVSLPLFFFEPYTATLLALCAIILLYAAFEQYKQDNKDNLVLGV